MTLTRLAITRPVAIWMLFAALIVMGLLGYASLPAELNPKVDFPTVSITTTYAGTNPQEMETLITKPIEDSIAGVSGVKQINSTSQQGLSNVTVNFYFGTNLDTADADVIQKVDAIRRRLPTAADSPSVTKRDTGSQPVLYIAMQSKTRSTTELQSIATNLILPSLEQASDVGGVRVFGGTAREIHISVSQAKLASLGITLSDLATAINNANVNVPGGFVQSGQQYYDVRIVGEFASIDEIRNLRLSVGGKAFYLSDVADIQDTIQEKTTDSILERAQRRLPRKRDAGRSKDLRRQHARRGQGRKAQLKKLSGILPPDIYFTITEDASTEVTDNLSDVVVSLMLGALLAILVVYIFLHNLRGTLIVAIALPTSMISTFLPLWALGYSLNTMTLLGLSLAVGILVDDSIVVLENINRHLAMGEEPTEAAINGRTEIGLAAITLTSVNLVVFLPIAFMGGVVGEFFRSFGMTVAFATAFSLIVSFTLTPQLAARWYRKGETMEYTRGFAGAFDRRFFALEHAYQRILRGILTFGYTRNLTPSQRRNPALVALNGVFRWFSRGPLLVFLFGNLFLVLIFAFVAPSLGFRFAPDQDQNEVSISVEDPAGVSLAYTKSITDQIEHIIRTTPDLNSDTQFIFTALGTSSAGGQGSGVTGTQYATMSLTLYNRASLLDTARFWRHEHLRHRSDVNVATEVKKLTKGIPGARILPSNVSGFSGGGAPLQVNLTGPSFPDLISATNKVAALIAATPGAYNVDTSFKNSQPEVEVRIDRVRAPEYGLSVEQIAQALSDNVGGNVNAEYRDPADGQQYYIRVQLNKTYRNDPQSVGNVIVGYQNGNPIYLSDVANITVGAGPTKIDRLNRQRTISVTAFLLPGVQVGNVSVVVSKKLDEMQKRGDFGQVTYSFGGETQTLQDEIIYIITAIVLGILLSYMLMAALFNNLMYPLSIMLSLPQAWAGAMIALLIAQEPVSLIAMIGFLYLNAIVSKNAILLVDYTNTLRSRGYKRIDALVEAGPVRLRPIMMTTICVICSSIPTALALGRGSSFRQSLGVTVIGGVVFSLFLTLLIVPSTYILYDNFVNWLSRMTNRHALPIEELTAAPVEVESGGGRGNGARNTNGYADGRGQGRNDQDYREEAEGTRQTRE